MNELQRKRINLINGYSLEAIAIAVLLFLGYDTAISPFYSLPRLKMIIVALLGFGLLVCKPFYNYSKRNIAFIAIIILTIFNAYVKTNSISEMLACFNVISWILCAYFAQMILLEKREIKLVLLSVKYASIIASVILLLNNKWFSSQYEYSLLFTTINRNGVVIFTSTGLAIVLMQVLFSKCHKINYLFLAIIGVTGIQANSRAMFVSIIVIVGSIMFHYLRTANDENKVKKAISILLILAILIATWFIAMPSDYINRLWNPDAYSLGESSRTDLWHQAFEMTKDPILGMGPNYCQNHLYHKSGEHLYGSHNFIVDSYTNSGLVVSLLSLYILLSYIKKEWLLFAFYITPFMGIMVESGRSISTWGSLMIIGLIFNRALVDKMTFSEEVIDILESKKNANER